MHALWFILKPLRSFIKGYFAITKFITELMHHMFYNFFITYYTVGIFKKLAISDTLRANAVAQNSILNKLACVHRMMRISKTM